LLTQKATNMCTALTRYRMGIPVPYMRVTPIMDTEYAYLQCIDNGVGGVWCRVYGVYGVYGVCEYGV
jgi:hypothetical protein